MVPDRADIVYSRNRITHENEKNYLISFLLTYSLTPVSSNRGTIVPTVRTTEKETTTLR